MKIFLAIWPTKDQTGCMRRTGYEHILTSFHNDSRFKKDFRPFFDKQQKKVRKKK